MAVRNCAELGINLQKIVSRLMANEDLVKLLYYEDADPLGQSALSAQQKKELIFEKLIKTVPRVGTKDTAKSIVVVYITNGRRISENKEFRNVSITVDIFVPLTQWFIKDTNLRPFAIMGEVQKSLDGKRINGLGELSGGDFDLSGLTDEVSIYTQTYEITEYD